MLGRTREVHPREVVHTTGNEVWSLSASVLFWTIRDGRFESSPCHLVEAMPRAVDPASEIQRAYMDFRMGEHLLSVEKSLPNRRPFYVRCIWSETRKSDYS